MFEVNVIHEALFVAVQEHPLRTDTLMKPAPPIAGKESLDRLMSYSQGSGAASICETVNVWPAIVSEPIRGAPLLLSGAVKPTEPLPVPVAPDVMVIHDTLLRAVQEQCAAVVTVTGLPDPPAAGMAPLVGVIEYVQGGGGGGDGGAGAGGAGSAAAFC